MSTNAYIGEAYRGNSTTITHGNGSVFDLQIGRGVRQGDPLSPILFNCVLDEFLVTLDQHRGVQIGDAVLHGLACADDCVFFAPNMQEAQCLLRSLDKFLRKRGMTLNPTKCQASIVAVLPHRKTLVTVTRGRMYIGPKFISNLGPLDVQKYLGRDCSRLLKAPLKPSQKLDILKHYLLPRYLFSLQSPVITKKTLRFADHVVRKTTKQAIHLPITSPNPVLYAPTSGDGLGLVNFEARVPSILHKRSSPLRGVKVLRCNWNVSRPGQGLQTTPLISIGGET